MALFIGAGCAAKLGGAVGLTAEMIMGLRIGGAAVEGAGGEGTVVETSGVADNGVSAAEI
jgi:hypothetical protein